MTTFTEIDSKLYLADVSARRFAERTFGDKCNLVVLDAGDMLDDDMIGTFHVCYQRMPNGWITVACPLWMQLKT